MSHNGPYYPSQWANTGNDRNYPASTNRITHRAFTGSAPHPDDTGFVPSGSTTMTPEPYSSGSQASFLPMNQPVFGGRLSSGGTADSSPHRGTSMPEAESVFRSIGHGIGPRVDTSVPQVPNWRVPSNVKPGPIAPPRPTQPHLDYESNVRPPARWDQDSPSSRESLEYISESSVPRGQASTSRGQGKGHSQRRPSNRDEFDGPHQFLERPSTDTVAAQERDLPHVPTNLYVQEQDDVLSQVNDRLSKCAFDFVAKYQFPIPLESDKRPVSRPEDREWTEWVYLLKRLATKRRIPARVLYNGQIKQLVTVLENSLEMRHAAKHQSRPLKDDRNVLQLISAGIQVAKILKDAATMEYLDNLYLQTERVIQARKTTPGFI